MRIGIDIDDTITNTYCDILKEVALNYNISYKSLLDKKVNYNYVYSTFPNYREFCLNNYEKIVKNVSLKDNVIEVLEKLKKNNEIIFITARNKSEYNDPYNVTKNFLDSNKVPYNELNVEVLDKGKFCYENNIDLFIDDSIYNCISVLKYNINTLLFDNPYNKDSNIKRVYNWLEILEYIEEEQWKKE